MVIAGDLAIIMIPEELPMSGKLLSSALIDRAINACIHTPPAARLPRLHFRNNCLAQITVLIILYAPLPYGTTIYYIKYYNRFILATLKVY